MGSSSSEWSLLSNCSSWNIFMFGGRQKNIFSPPGSHNSHRCDPSSRGNPRPSSAYLLLSILISPIHPESQIFALWPPGSHNSHRWRPSREGNHRPSLRYLLWVIPKVAICFYVGILTRFSQFCHRGLRFYRKSWRPSTSTKRQAYRSTNDRKLGNTRIALAHNISSGILYG